MEYDDQSSYAVRSPCCIVQVIYFHLSHSSLFCLRKQGLILPSLVTPNSTWLCKLFLSIAVLILVKCCSYRIKGATKEKLEGFMYCFILFVALFLPLHFSVCAHSCLSHYYNTPGFVSSLFQILPAILFLPVTSLSIPCESQTPSLAFPLGSKEIRQNGSKSTMFFVNHCRTAQKCTFPISHIPTRNGLWRVEVSVGVPEVSRNNVPKTTSECRSKICLIIGSSCFHTQCRVDSCELAFLIYIGICKLKINTNATFQNKMLIHVPSGNGERTHCVWWLSQVTVVQEGMYDILIFPLLLFHYNGV